MKGKGRRAGLVPPHALFAGRMHCCVDELTFGVRCSEVSAGSDGRSEWSSLATLLLHRLTTRPSDVSGSDLNSHGTTVNRQRDGVRHWVPQLLCQLDCTGGSPALDRASNSRQKLPPAVKRQLDLNIVLSNYIKHRLGKDE